MRLLVSGLMAALLMSAASAAAVDGTWQGEAGTQKIELELSTGADGTVTGRMRGLSSGTDLPLTGRVEGDRLTVAIPALEFALDAKVDGNEMEGNGSRGGSGFDVELARSAPRAPATRPQDPVAPLPYRAEEVSVPGPAGALAGTLTLPEGAGPFPAVVLITPDGPQDRNGQAFAHRPSLVLADALTRAGFIVLRYDDRGVGGSGGDYVKATTVDFGGDASAAIAFLKARKDVDPAKLGLIGRGNGAAAAAIAGKDLPALVLISAPTLVGADGLNAATARQMREDGEDEDDIAERVALQTKAFAVAADPSKTEADIRAIIKALIDEAAGLMSFAVPDGVVEQMTRQMSSPWFRHYLTYDPKADYAKLTGRVLFLYGAEDRANPPADNAAVAVAAASGAKAETTSLPGLAASLAAYNPDREASVFDRAETLDANGIKAVVSWLTGALGAS